MDRLRVFGAFFTISSVAFAQPALIEPPDYPPVQPGPGEVHDGASCFLLASGTMVPGDVDWVQLSIPWATTRTVVDVDFPAGSGSSVLLVSRIGGGTVLGLADSNNPRDTLCGLSGSTAPPGSPTDSAVEVGPTPRHSVLDIGVSGWPDTAFTGQHTHSFGYEVWVFINPILCTSDAGCADSVACTVDTCDVDTGICNSAANHSACLDSSYCNGAEFCHATLGCRLGAAVNCNDGLSCTIDSCNESLDSCVHSPIDDWCDNGTFCDGVEWCDVDLGCQSGAPETCDDGEDCTVDTCDPDIDDCVFTSSGDACDDGLFCNGQETCDPDSGCAAGGDPCPNEFCDEAGDRCVECVDDFDCDDGVFCNGAERCDLAAGTCDRGPAVVCDDQNDCTTDHCDAQTDGCTHAPDDGACDDGEFCNGTERCDAELGCMSGDAPCSDGFCDEELDRCVDCLSDEDCDDGVFCNGAERCNALTGTCHAGTTPCASPEQCNEDAQVCESNAMSIDIKPGQCPNVHKPQGNDFLKVAIVGSRRLNVARIAANSVLLGRADGTGSWVAPMERGHGRSSLLNDVSTDSQGESCACNGSVGGDGIADLVLRFDDEVLVRDLRLDMVRPGTVIDLVVTGQLLDGTKFSATDCVTIVTPKKEGKRYGRAPR